MAEIMGGLWKESISFEGTLWGGGSFWGIQKDLVRRAQGMVMSVSLGILRDS
jgi:hypothetical protein